MAVRRHIRRVNKAILKTAPLPNLFCFSLMSSVLFLNITIQLTSIKPFSHMTMKAGVAKLWNSTKKHRTKTLKSLCGERELSNQAGIYPPRNKI